MARPPVREQRGFSLVEALVAIALTTGVMLGVTSAVLHAIHANADESTKIALRDDALSALADLRAATAYDPTMLATVTAHGNASQTITRSNAAAETITIHVQRSVGPGPSNVIATATATQLDASVTEQTTLYNEAPAPGSTIDE